MELAESERENFSHKRKRSPRTRNQASECDINIPGLNRLFNESRGKSAKIIWSLSMLTCAGFCLYFTADRLQKYFEYPTATNTRVKYDHKIQFPSLSICLVNVPCFVNVLCNEMGKRDVTENNDACWRESNASLKDWNINPSEIWKNCNFISVDANVVFAGNKNHSMNSDNFVSTTTYSIFGNCATISHTEKVTFLSVSTSLRIILTSKYKSELILIPHGLPVDKINNYELFNHNVEFFESGDQTIFKIHEQVNIYENVTGRECYDYDSERKRIYDHASSIFDQIGCKLPLLAGNIPDCRTISDVARACFDIVDKYFWMLEDDSWTIKRICNRSAYTISVDSASPIQARPLESDISNVSVTVVIIKFSDASKTIVTEYFSYTLPALISDLFAYWGFFLCLSAPVFLEIFEFVVITVYRIYLSCSISNKRNAQ